MIPEWMAQCDSDEILLVEGNDDCNIIEKFCQDNDLEDSFNYCNCHGDNKLLSKLISILKITPNTRPKIIGVILDADNDIKARYKDIKDKLNQYNNLPTDFPTNGLIVKQEQLPKLGIWIMPNNKDNGALEDFYLTITPIDTDFIDDCIKKAQEKNLISFKNQHLNKAIMHTYFAWQDKPGMPLHSAIKKLALNSDHAIAKKFKDWLEELYLTDCLDSPQASS